MTPALIIFALFLFLTAYNAGVHLTLHIQHYAVYPLVGREGYAAYMEAQNRAAKVPAVLPGLALDLVAVALVAHPPSFVSPVEAWLALALNVVALFSTFRWQVPLQGEMAKSGWDERKFELLMSTNRIRPVAFLLQAGLAIEITMRALIAR